MSAKKLIGVVVAFMFSNMGVLAHQDVKLRIVGGKVMGLPHKYRECTIFYDRSQISINDEILSLPGFLAGILKSERVEGHDGDVLFKVGVYWRLTISGAWSDEKDESGLADYMILSFLPKNKDFRLDVYVRLEDPAIMGSKVVLTTYSQEDGDEWVRGIKANGLSSTQMELMIGEQSELDWELPKR